MKQEPLFVGADRVVPKDDGSLLVYSREPKEDTWRVRRSRKTKIFFRGHAYFIESINDGKNEADLLFALRPWPEDSGDIPGAVVEYDERYVAALHASYERQRKVERPMGIGMLLLSPILGLAWEAPKRRWEEQFGVPAMRLTRYSVYVAGTFSFMTGASKLVFMTIAGYAGGMARSTEGVPEDLMSIVPWWLFAIAVPLGVDSLVRYMAVNERAPRAYGFFESFFHPTA